MKNILRGILLIMFSIFLLISENILMFHIFILSNFNIGWRYLAVIIAFIGLYLGLKDLLYNLIKKIKQKVIKNKSMEKSK